MEYQVEQKEIQNASRLQVKKRDGRLEPLTLIKSFCS